VTPSGVTAFLDFAPSSYGDGVAFWRAVTGYELSPARGEHGEFATLVPPDGEPFLRLQRLAGGPDGLHLDLHVADPRQAAEDAVRHGARQVADLGHQVMASPGGFVFCLVGDSEATRPVAETRHDGGHTSLLDQVCIDIPAASWDTESAFWASVTARDLRDSPSHAEFRRLLRPQDQHLELLLQRLDDETGDARAHFDWSTSDRAAEVARHEQLGARTVAERGHWTVLADPLGREYCITDRRRSTPTRE
jgi:hypothetical protein